ncbi:hypothetical protein Micbo1qcDRAFT_165077 [Microdochium bolleyi]|uniref:Uncharacterized protein n=1 Tax=Microdochium bolleyi TaxID=196109 RepID=A0A136IXP4_9PEZI|nr:hypothetical protein Micbo1qcDRAFT_165077 [Microdochium bolleyi]
MVGQAQVDAELPLSQSSDPEPPLSEATKDLKTSRDGILALGLDGVLRSFDGERNVIDARGLDPAQIREYVGPGNKAPPRLLSADGRHISEWDMYHPAADEIPNKPTEEDRARTRQHNEELLRRGLTCDPPRPAIRDYVICLASAYMLHAYDDSSKRLLRLLFFVSITVLCAPITA